MCAGLSAGDQCVFEGLRAGVCVCAGLRAGVQCVCVRLRAGDQVRSLRNWCLDFDLTLRAIHESMSLKLGGTRVYEHGIGRYKSL